MSCANVANEIYEVDPKVNRLIGVASVIPSHPPGYATDMENVIQSNRESLKKKIGKIIVSYRCGLISSDHQLSHEVVIMLLLALQGDLQFTILSTGTYLHWPVEMGRLL